MAKKHSKEELELADQQIDENKKPYEYQSQDYPVGVLIGKFIEGPIRDFLAHDQRDFQKEIFIPDYQREFIWTNDRKSRFIESILLEIPLPPLFVAVNKDLAGLMEIIDGRQRMQTLYDFYHNRFPLGELEKLTLLKGIKFSQLTIFRQRKFLGSNLRVHILQEGTDSEAKADIFNRINTGSAIAKPSEIRKGAYDGPYYDFIMECAQNSIFQDLCPVSDIRLKRGEREELVLRFFAYSQRFGQFRHDVAGFLDLFLKDRKNDVPTAEERESFNRMLNFVNTYFPNGFRRSASDKSTPRVRFEAIALGVHFALSQNAQLVPSNPVEVWLNSPEFKAVTTSDASNNLDKFQGRVLYVKSQLLGQ